MMPVIIVARRPSAYAKRIIAGLDAAGHPPSLFMSGSRVELLVGPIEKILRVRRQLGFRETLRYVQRLNEKLPTTEPVASLDALMAATGCKQLIYDAVNSGLILTELVSRAPAIVVLAGTGVVDRAFLAANGQGFVVNGHPALLPGIRGVDVIEWALAENRPLGVTAHLVTPSVDAGDLLNVRPIEIETSDTSLEALKARIIDRQADAVVAATVSLARNEAAPWQHDLTRSVLRLTAPARIHAIARANLTRQIKALTAAAA